MSTKHLLRRAFATKRRKNRRGGGNWIGGGEPTEMSPAALAALAADLKLHARSLGLGPTAVTSARASARFPQYEAWLAEGLHGDLEYMARADRVARRREPNVILPGAKAVVMTSLFYWPGRAGFPDAHAVAGQRPVEREGCDSGGGASGGGARGVVSCYAWGADYHILLEERLKSLGEFLRERAGGTARFYVDTGAVLERDFAQRAGLGFIGKNSLLINPRAGSGFFIGGLFTNIPLPLDGDEDILADAKPKRGTPGCGSCRKCIVACPTDAIIRDRVIDARRCISYLTIELKTAIPVELREKMGTRIYGCDICQQVCPWNKFDWSPPSKPGASPLFGQAKEEVSTPRLIALLWETKKSFRMRYAGTALERIGHERMARNAAVALGNIGGSAELMPVGLAAFAHSSALVREHAQWALGMIKTRLHSL